MQLFSDVASVAIVNDVYTNELTDGLVSMHTKQHAPGTNITIWCLYVIAGNIGVYIQQQIHIHMTI